MQDVDISRIDGHALRVFLSVCETGSISRTADVFDLNQSTISHTIEKLRAALGDPLFVKSGRGITPTDRAIALAPQVQEILARIEGLIASDRYVAANDTKPFTIAVPTPALMEDMKTIYDVLRREAPGALFQVIRLAPRERLTEMLADGEADLAIAINAPKLPATLNAARYGGDRLVVFYDPAKRGPVETVEDYAAATHGVAGFGGKTKSIVEAALEDLGLQRHVGFTSPTASTLGDFVKGSDMIATMPSQLAKGAYAGLAHAPPPVALPDIRYDLVWHRRFDESGRSRWFRNVVLNAAAKRDGGLSAPDGGP